MLNKTISCGKISGNIYRNYAEITASFMFSYAEDGEVLLPFIPKGIIFDLRLTCKGEEVFSSRAVNIREYNALARKEGITVSRRGDGVIVLGMYNVSEKENLEITVRVFARINPAGGCAHLVFPGIDMGIESAVSLNLKVLGDVLKVESPTHKITEAVSYGVREVILSANPYTDALDIAIFYKDNGENDILVSRRLFGDNIALCSFTPKLCREEEIVYLQAIGGIGVSLFPDKISKLVLGKAIHCFAKHSVIPPKGIRIYDKNKKLVEEILFDIAHTQLEFFPVEIMYAMECIKELKEKQKTAPPEDRCIIREEINEICLRNKIVYEDIALGVFSGSVPHGLIDVDKTKARDIRKLCENMDISPEEVIEYILSCQTVCGAIGDIFVWDKDMLVFSTAVCLICLYLYTGNKYGAFAKRSLEFLKDKKGYWSETAKCLWRGEDIDFPGLFKRADMKIMYERTDELAVALIKNYRRRER